MAMNATTVPLTVTDEASEFLKKHGLEEAFRTMCELARQHFPELLRIEAAYEKDPDEPDVFQYVAVMVYVPKDHDVELFGKQEWDFSRKEAEMFPPRTCELVRVYPWRSAE